MTLKSTDSPLEQIIYEEMVRNGGVVSLGRYMDLTLMHPEHGYYTMRDPFGEAGDFTTAPEVSQMFGEMIGAWLIDVWAQMGAPDINLVECGPGRGTLMADIMRVANRVDGFVDKVHIWLIEGSKLLRKQQVSALKDYQVRWVTNVSEIETDRPCLVIGNEFLDALPIEQLKRTKDGWLQCYVTRNEAELGFVWQAPQDGLLEHLPPKTESHQTYEVSPARCDFMDECMTRIMTHGGAGLFIDYGHAKSHYGDTLQAVKAHNYVSVLDMPGQVDITAHVDFDALGVAAKKAGGVVEPVVTQRCFLQMLGIESRAAVLAQKAPDAKSIHRDLTRLIGEEEMGRLFKVFCTYSGDKIKPAGF